MRLNLVIHLPLLHLIVHMVRWFTGVPTQMDVVLSNLDERVCNVVTALGEITDITTAANSQCNLLGSQPALSQVGNMSTIPGWNNVISNMAQSMENLWLTVCDMRSVIYDLKECCDGAVCSAFILAYTANANTARTEVTLIFNGSTVIPSGFSNCPLLSTVSITDGIGATVVNDAPLFFDAVTTGSQPWEPKNYDGTFDGPMPLKRGLAKSKNMVSSACCRR